MSLILGIESSCDETSISLVEDGRVLVQPVERNERPDPPPGSDDDSGGGDDSLIRFDPKSHLKPRS